MNLNVESHFANLPRAEIQRSRFDRSHSHKTTFNVGDIVPIYLDQDILPGDTVTIDTSKVIRLQTLLTPIMDNVYLDTYFFFIPNRLLWSHWKNFMGENTASAWASAVTYTVPQMKITSGDKVASGTLLDYLGVPPGTYGYVSSLPVRAYSLVCNEWFRDENLTNPMILPTGDNDTTYDSDGSCEYGGVLFKAAKYHDYFTSCLPSTLKAASPVTIPGAMNSGILARVGIGNIVHGSLAGDILGDTTHESTYDYLMSGHMSAGNTTHVTLKSATVSGTSGLMQQNTLTMDGSTLDSPASGGFRPDNLYAYIPKDKKVFSTDASSGFSITVSDLREAFQIQKLLEKDSRSGSRYTEVILAHFGTRSPDSRLQRPEYLGGNRVNISVHQVTNQAQGENDFLGNLGAFALKTDRHSDFTYSATEHGIILGLAVARYDHTYSQGVERGWLRKSRYDYYWPVLAHISEQPVYKEEIYVGTQIPQSKADFTVFGYNEPYADYRYKPNRLSGEMRPDITNTLATWHLGDDYNAAPTLSDAWIREDKSNIDRVLAVTSAVSNQILLDVYFNAWYTRPIPLYGVPGLVDHF